MAARCLATLGLLAHNAQSAHDAVPQMAKEYSAVIQVRMPYIGLNMPLRILTSNDTQKIEYYDGLETDLSSATGTFKFTFNNSKRICMFHAASTGPTEELTFDKWAPEAYVPDLSEYTRDADELVGGVMCHKFTLKAQRGKTGVMNDVVSFYWDPVLSKPVRWHQHSRGMPFGSHTDEYILDYLSFQPGAPAQVDLGLPDPSCHTPVTTSAPARRGLLAAVHQNEVAEKSARFVEFLNKKHAGQTTFKANRYMHMTKEEVMSFRGGKRSGSSRDRRTEEHLKYVSEHAMSGNAVPTAFDWRTAKPGVVGPVKDQAMCGSCWTYGAMGPVEQIKAIQTGELVTLPEQYMLDCAWTNGTGASAGNFGCDGGDSDIGILEIVRKFGGIIPTATAYGSYLSVNGYCKDIRTMEVGAKVSGWKDIPKFNASAFKDALVQNGPISVGIMVPDEMLYFDSGTLDVASCKCDESQIDHAVEVVGFGVDADGKNFFTVRNSWSTYWGNEGYINIVEGENDCCVTAQAGYPVVDAIARSSIVV